MRIKTKPKNEIISNKRRRKKKRRELLKKKEGIFMCRIVCLFKLGCPNSLTRRILNYFLFLLVLIIWKLKKKKKKKKKLNFFVTWIETTIHFSFSLLFYNSISKLKRNINTIKKQALRPTSENLLTHTHTHIYIYNIHSKII